MTQHKDKLHLIPKLSREEVEMHSGQVTVLAIELRNYAQKGGMKLDAGSAYISAATIYGNLLCKSKG